MTRPRIPTDLPVSRTVGLNIANLRAQRCWSLRDLAANTAVGPRRIPVSALHYMERAVNSDVPVRSVSVDDLVSLARAFGVPPTRLLAEPEGAAHDEERAVVEGVPECGWRLGLCVGCPQREVKPERRDR